MHIIAGAGNHAIRTNKPTNLGVIVPCLQIVEAAFGIVVVAAVAEGIEVAKGDIGACYRFQFTPGIVGIFC